ncbi:hypothetical protein GCM10011495_33770 [Hymenobacter frigidus]|uniref:Uncharacterized protein n=1 Tax=Hymenobacter frigidus TaxID=1524095 RepID=A0ABQ2AEZ1_9BACT|nr:hypothetical protein GCM10011495_33770 [Hymenobacter frigidus]
MPQSAQSTAVNSLMQLLAKDKNFEAHLVTLLAAGLPAVAAVPQDLGRVLINLFTNAFHAVQERRPAPPLTSPRCR